MVYYIHINNGEYKMTKERKLPFKCVVYDKEPVEVSNRLSGNSIIIPPDAVAVYDVIMGEQLVKNTNWDNVRKGLDWFAKHEPDAYMVLLD
tara:strand:+ start:271 stop:543 length:273 start_codon:yes stop_codon:yes gene_type:complete